MPSRIRPKPSYDFTLRFQLPDPDADPESFLGALLNAGCDDAAVGMGRRGRIALDFSRSASSAERALQRAIADVQRAIPGAQLIEASPDYVGASDIAEVLGVTRQYVLMQVSTFAGHFPAPVHEGTRAVYHLSPVLEWFATARNRAIDAKVRAVAAATMRENVRRAFAALEVN